MSSFITSDTNEESVPRILSTSVEVTPMLKWGGLILIGLALFFAIEKASIFVSELSAEVEALQLQKSGLLRVSEAPDVSQEIVRLASQIQSLEMRYFRQATAGLNSASFQTIMAQTLSDCGLENLSISVKNIEAENIPQTGTLIASIRARDSKQRIATCLAKLRSNPYSLEVTSLNWLRSGSIQMEIRSHYMPKQS